MGLLRLLLALSVVSEHSSVFPFTGNSFVGGQVAVEAFFMISGFYMALVLNEKYASPRDFYYNRFLRLFPTFWVIAILAVVGDLSQGNASIISRVLFASWTWGSKLLMLSSNFMIVGSDWMLFLYPAADGIHATSNFNLSPGPFHAFHQIPQAWSLPLELMFYSLAPFAVKSWKRLFVLALLSLGIRHGTYLFIGNNDPWSYRFFPSELVFFCLGSLAYHFYTRFEGHRFAAKAGAVALALLILYVTFFDRAPTWFPDTTLFSGKLIQFYVILLCALPFVFIATKKSAADRWLGELSYPLYLVHVPIVRLAAHWPKFSPTQVYNVAVYSLIASILINHYFQDRVEKAFKRDAGAKSI